MLVALAEFALHWAGILIVLAAILIVVGALTMGGFDEHRLSKPAAQRKPKSNAP